MPELADVNGLFESSVDMNAFTNVSTPPVLVAAIVDVPGVEVLAL